VRKNRPSNEKEEVVRDDELKNLEYATLLGHISKTTIEFSLNVFSATSNRYRASPEQYKSRLWISEVSSD